MTFLPIAERELRVAARRRSTYWVRLTAAAAGLTIGSGVLLILHLGAGRTASAGSALFSVLTWLTLVAVLSAGLFLTSDALSEERREGTLGLLFLTDLRGYDVAAGKMLATSLQGFYSLLALLPVVAAALLVGGVTGTQFTRTCVALVNALFLSLSAGLLVSALSRDAQRALFATLFLLFVLTLGGPIADAIIAEARSRPYAPYWSLASPGFVFSSAGDWGRSPFWRALAITHALAWGAFAGACLLAPRTWQDRSGKSAASSRNWLFACKYGGQGRRQRVRRRLLACNPMLWLACRERWQALGLWIIALVMLGVAAFLLANNYTRDVWAAWVTSNGLFVLAFYLWAASQASHLFVEARRAGVLELLLVTPLSIRQIVHGQWLGFVRHFGPPLCLLLTLQFLAIVLSGQIVAGPITIGIGSQRELAPALASAAMTATATGANLLALLWFGMWMGMTSKNASLATLKTVAFAQVIPWMAIVFTTSVLISGLVSSLARSGASFSGLSPAWVPVLYASFPAALTLLKDLIFIRWSRNKLYRSFRDQAVRDSAPTPAAAASTPLPTAAPAVEVLVGPTPIAAEPVKSRE